MTDWLTDRQGKDQYKIRESNLSIFQSLYSSTSLVHWSAGREESEEQGHWPDSHSSDPVGTSQQWTVDRPQCGQHRPKHSTHFHSQSHYQPRWDDNSVTTGSLNILNSDVGADTGSVTNTTVTKMIEAHQMRTYDELRELDIEETPESLRQPLWVTEL